MTLTLGQQVVLGLTKRTWLHDSYRSRLLARHIDDMLKAGFAPCPGLDPATDPPVLWLRHMCRAAPPEVRFPSHDITDVLGRLMRKGAPYEAEVALRAVVGVYASKADDQMNLDAIPETMNLLDGEGFGPLKAAEMGRLRDAVMREFSPLTRSEGIFELDLQGWNGAYVAANTGASRRFALWRRLAQREDPPVRIRARVTRYDLDADALQALRDRWRLVLAREGDLLGPFREAEEVMPDSFCSFGAWQGLARERCSFFFVPYTDRVPTGLAGAMRLLHRRIDEAGVLDVGRCLTEQASVARRRRVPA